MISDEQVNHWAVFCSDGPENGYRVPMSNPPEKGCIEMGYNGCRKFRWDGTLDENGDARYRERPQTTIRSSSS